ncbi:hypothetical protein DPMN_165558 [Dreissena polymorpha]|uniref:Uncharacterized protein n=1 Tax=Dreissena polymorpha TaxID=45954 RepID=A0A9D4EV24_DREPO|nr:hypothetical protein DPMN_165558 [Dreissena polymorpha]
MSENSREVLPKATLLLPKLGEAKLKIKERSDFISDSNEDSIRIIRGAKFHVRCSQTLELTSIKHSREFQSLAALKRKELMPYLVVLTLGITAVLEYLKEYEVCSTVNRIVTFSAIGIKINLSR